MITIPVYGIYLSLAHSGPKYGERTVFVEVMEYNPDVPLFTYDVEQFDDAVFKVISSCRIEDGPLNLCFMQGDPMAYQDFLCEAYKRSHAIHCFRSILVHTPALVPASTSYLETIENTDLPELIHVCKLDCAEMNSAALASYMRDFDNTCFAITYEGFDAHRISEIACGRTVYIVQDTCDDVFVAAAKTCLENDNFILAPPLNLKVLENEYRA